jgi:hypothetical protein
MGWLIAGWFLLLFIAVTIWHNFGWSRMQRRVAQQRPSLDRQAYVDVFAISDVSPNVAGAIYDALQPCCVKGVAPHPDDGLVGFYFDDPEDMEDLVEEMFVKLGLPMPTRYEPEITPHLESARKLGVCLQSKIDSAQFSLG